MISRVQILHRPAYSVLKRGVDVVLSALLLLIFLPLMAVVAIWVSLESRGGALFKQNRVGKDGRPFKIIKFRTMVTNAESIGPLVTSSDDQRITRSGKILRATKIDELPQLWNVLVGEMSIVGPRPQVPKYVDLFDPEFRRIILSVRPGITGPTALQFRHEESILDSRRDREAFYVDVLLPIKCQLDVDYVRSAGFKADLVAFFSTFTVLFRGLGHRLLGRPIGKKIELSVSHKAIIQNYSSDQPEVVTIESGKR